MPSRRLSYNNVANLLDCSPRTIKRLVERGLLAPPINYNGVGLRFREEDVLVYMAVQEARQVERSVDRTGQDAPNRPPEKDS